MTRLFEGLRGIALTISLTLFGCSMREAAQLALAGIAPVFGGADTDFATGATETVKRWAAKIWIEASRELYFGKLMKEGDDNAAIEVKTELEKGPGDKITFSLARKLALDGVADDAMLEGNEESLTVYSDSVTLAQRRHAVRLNGRMSERRTAFDQRMVAKTQLKTWLAEYIDNDMFTQFDTAPTTTVFGGAAVSTATIDATCKFTPALIDKCIAKAKKATPKIWPVRLNGQDYWIMVLHTDVSYDLKQDPAWQQAQREANVRDMMKNPIFSGALGYWGGAVIHECEKVPVTTNYGAGNNLAGASNLFLGRQAGVFAWGKRPEGWEKEFDYGAKTGFAIGAIWKFKKAVFNAADNAFTAVRVFRTNN